MLVDETAFALTGYLSADESGAGFVVPLFTGRSSNMVLVQEIGSDGRVEGFREVEPRSFRRLEDSSRHQSVGKPALWGFRTVAGSALIDEREVLRDFLISQMDTLEAPFLKLQVAQFCEDLEELVGAWRTAYDHLEERSPKSAQAWRDVVIIPTQMRLAVEHAILEHALDASVEHLTRTVDVALSDGVLQLYLSPDLHAALMGNAGARRSLEHSAAPIRHAFHLSDQRVALIEKEPATARDSEAAIADEVAIAGFGDMAMSLIAQVVPRIERVDPRIRRAAGGQSLWYPAPRNQNEIVLLQRDELEGKADWEISDQPPMLNEDNRILLVTFQLGALHSQIMETAIAFAKKHRRKHRIVVAVIPHLPHEFGDDCELSKSIIPTLNHDFDAVWALSDRSPYTRQALPYGPARSLQASATHFRYLLRLAQHQDSRDELLGDAQNPEALNLIGSATGDRTVSKLAEHAMMRLAHHLFELKSATSAQVVGGSREQPADFGQEILLREIMLRECPNAKVKVRTTARRDGGPDQISVILKGVTVVDRGAEAFETYCVTQLERFGWSIDQFEPDGLIHVTHRELENVPTDCKYVISGLVDTALRSRRRRQHDVDGILLTNASIRRRNFAMHVLNGVTPVHSSRIEALHRIYRRRYAYALTFLRQNRKTSERLLVPAALDWLNAHPWIDTKNLGKGKIPADCRPTVEFTPGAIALTLPLELVRGRGRNAAIVRGEARIKLDESGWHLLEVGADGTDLARR